MLHDPTRLTDGIEASDDPVLAVRNLFRWFSKIIAVATTTNNILYFLLFFFNSSPSISSCPSSPSCTKFAEVNFAGNDSFTFRVNNGKLSETEKNCQYSNMVSSYRNNTENTSNRNLFNTIQ
jgi:hypothetical protein